MGNTLDTIEKLRDLSGAALRSRRAETGIRESSIMFSLPYFIPYRSFPKDTMHTVYNCGRRYLEPATGVATKVGTGRPSGHPRPPGDGGDSCRRRLGYDEPDAGQA